VVEDFGDETASFSKPGSIFKALKLTARLAFEFVGAPDESHLVNGSGLMQSVDKNSKSFSL
jgi:hypothetical protein